MPSDNSRDTSRREQLHALIRVGKYKPIYTVAIIVAGLFVAMLEAVGLSFIVPIVESSSLRATLLRRLTDHY